MRMLRHLGLIASHIICMHHSRWISDSPRESTAVRAALWLACPAAWCEH